MSIWETIFMRSPVNEGHYDEEDLPQQNWEWPKGTWFQARLDYIREHHAQLALKTSIKMRRGHDVRTI